MTDWVVIGLDAELDTRHTMIELLHCDCMEYMATVPDKYFDLAIVDPPYGIKIMNSGGKGTNGWLNWEKKDWDNATHDKRILMN